MLLIAARGLSPKVPQPVDAQIRTLDLFGEGHAAAVLLNNHFYRS